MEMGKSEVVEWFFLIAYDFQLLLPEKIHLQGRKTFILRG